MTIAPEVVERMERLEPCPFCGGEASDTGRTTYSGKSQEWWADGSPVRIAYFVNCMSCGVACRSIVGGYQTPEEAVKRWNTRVGRELERSGK